MKKLILVLSLFGGMAGLKAQQDAQYSQFFLNKLTYNPAYAGSEDKICATGLYRSQWLGFGNDKSGYSPTTFLANINAPIGKSFGAGLNITRDQLGFEVSVNPMLSLAYRYHFKNESVLAAGVGAGVMQKSLAGTKLNPLESGDPFIPGSDVSGYAADFNFGLYYTMPSLWRFNDFYAGASASHLTQGNVQYANINNPMKLHYYFMTGASYGLSPSLAIEPNLLIKTDLAKTTADINAMVMYNNKIRGGLSYRTGDAVVVLVGYRFFERERSSLQLGYSYDLTTSDIISYSTGSHEIVLKYCFMPKFNPKPEKELVPRLTPRFL
ncbi:MAG: type IX secretion system membrane protein PorP/SprF [Bacteroidota bacterium]